MTTDESKTELIDDKPAQPIIERGTRGTWLPGQSGNPQGRSVKRRLTPAESRAELPAVIANMVSLAASDKKWLQKLKQADPGKFASLLVTLSRYMESDAADLGNKLAPVIEITNRLIDPTDYAERVEEALRVARESRAASLDGQHHEGDKPTKVDSKWKVKFNELKDWVSKSFAKSGKDTLLSYYTWQKDRIGRIQASEKLAIEQTESEQRMITMSSDPDDEDYDPDASAVWGSNKF